MFVRRHEYTRVFQSSSVLVRVEPAEVGLTPEPARQALDGRRERVGGILRPVPRAQVPLSGPRRARVGVRTRTAARATGTARGRVVVKTRLSRFGAGPSRRFRFADMSVIQEQAPLRVFPLLTPPRVLRLGHGTALYPEGSPADGRPAAGGLGAFPAPALGRVRCAAAKGAQVAREAAPIARGAGGPVLRVPAPLPPGGPEDH